MFALSEAHRGGGGGGGGWGRGGWGRPWGRPWGPWGGMGIGMGWGMGGLWGSQCYPWGIIVCPGFVGRRAAESKFQIINSENSFVV